MSDVTDEARTHAIEPPVFRPGNPMWDAGFESARRQAAEVCRARNIGGTPREDMEARRCARAILAMRPAAPTKESE